MEHDSDTDGDRYISKKEFILTILFYLFLIICLCVAVAYGETQIKRNSAMNEISKVINPFLDELTVVHAYLKKYEEFPRIPQYDVEALKKLDDAIDHAEIIEKNLKKIREEIKEGR